MDWQKHLEKNPIQKLKKKQKIKMKLPPINKNFCSNTEFLFKHRFPITLKLE